jgi:hypothetical protein
MYKVTNRSQNRNSACTPNSRAIGLLSTTDTAYFAARRTHGNDPQQKRMCHLEPLPLNAGLCTAPCKFPS